ncbi:MAG: hypothetical protein HGB19_07840, partial [Chlorobiales bacterium]|nr:hypothetical protein [Chlorobiales bacterium]
MRKIIGILLVMVVMWQFGINVAFAQEKGTERGKPLQEFLNPDGSLNLKKDYSGTLDPSGFQMKYGRNGEPLFEQVSKNAQTMVAGDEFWDDRFALQGVNSTVRAIAVSG